MKVLVVAAHFPISIARYLAEGFADAGHEVVTAGPAFGRWIPWNGGMELPESYVWTPTLALDRTVAHHAADVLAQVGSIDLVVHGDCNFWLTGNVGVPNVCYAVDNHVRKYDDREYDLIFGAHSWGFRHEEKHFHWLPCAYSPRWHNDGENRGDRPVDVGFVGVMYQSRYDVLLALQRSGYSTLIATGPGYDDANRLYNLCKVALGVSHNGDVPCRVIENMAQGCVVICDPQRDLDKLGLQDGKHLFTFSDLASLRAVMKQVLDYDRRQEIRQAAQAWVKEQTWQQRAEFIINKVFNG